MNPSDSSLGSSFRDPSGFVFRRDGALYRQVNLAYKEHYDHLVSSGLLAALVDAGLLIPHEETGVEPAVPRTAYKIIKPDMIPWISYPYEWCFSQLKAAALTTLAAQKKALEFGMSLKDSSAYNVQMRKGKPILIDTLSFEKYEEGRPWIAYKQFCEHFLAPLALMSYKDVRLSQMLRVFLDGIPLDVASELLPARSRLNFPVLTHIHLHAKSQRHYSDRGLPKNARPMSRLSFRGLIDSLETAVKNLHWLPAGTAWADYYDSTNYSPEAFDRKKQLVAEIVDKIKPKTVMDLGANTGEFSRIASKRGIFTVSADIDPAAVEKNYLECTKAGETNILPLWLDLTNPSPAIGWANAERMSWFERGTADMVFALALIHHLAIANNLPLAKLAAFFRSTCRYLVIEFVPKTDSQVKRLLASRIDIFPDYTQEVFEQEFSHCFRILSSKKIENTDRTLYLMEKVEA